MKRYSVLMILSLCLHCAGFAQDDDVYFVPSKSQKVETTVKSQKSAVALSQQNATKDYDNWADGRNNRGWDVDAYNRRGGKTVTSVDSIQEVEEPSEGAYTTRIVRFHSPRIGVYVSSPYYVDVFDYWGPSWYTSPWYYDWYGPSWYAGWWGRPWYGSWCIGVGWPHYWHSWYHPWYDYAWGWGSSWHGVPSWYRHGNGRYLDPNHRVTNYRPTRNYAYNNRRPGYMPSRSYGRTPSRSYGTVSNQPSSNRPSRNYGNTSTPSRNYNNSNSSRQPSRSNSDVRSSRSYGTPSQNSGGNRGGSYSAPSRNFGGGRSVGGGASRGRR